MKRFIVGLIAFVTLAAFSSDSRSQTGTSLLEETSTAFTQIADKAMPATVYIKCEVNCQSECYNPFDMYGDDFFRKFFNQQTPPPQQSAGSGFLISSDGFIVTNNHVIKDASKITVVLNDGREYTGTIKGADSRTDLALIKIDEKDLPYLNFGDSEKMRIGEWVVAIGNPFGLEATLTVGVVSAKGRQDLGIVPYEDFIQTDAAINPGNSGGPLLNLDGDVIGVNSAIVSRSGGYMGIGFAIPSKMTQNVIDQIMNKGSVKRGYLGIILQPVDKDLTEAFNLDKQEGLIISDVMKDTPAAKAGLQQGDIILQLNGKPVKTVSKFRNEIALMNPGTTVKLKILRNGKTLNVDVDLGSQSEGEALTDELTQKFGLELENLTPEAAQRLGLSPDVNGVLISKVKPGSPAALAGLRPGHVITGIVVNNMQRPLKNIGDFQAALQEADNGKHIVLVVRQQNYQRYYTIKIK